MTHRNCSRESCFIRYLWIKQSFKIVIAFCYMHITKIYRMFFVIQFKWQNYFIWNITQRIFSRRDSRSMHEININISNSSFLLKLVIASLPNTPVTKSNISYDSYFGKCCIEYAWHESIYFYNIFQTYPWLYMWNININNFIMAFMKSTAMITLLNFDNEWMLLNIYKVLLTVYFALHIFTYGSHLRQWYVLFCDACLCRGRAPQKSTYQWWLQPSSSFGPQARLTRCLVWPSTGKTLIVVPSGCW